MADAWRSIAGWWRWDWEGWPAIEAIGTLGAFLAAGILLYREFGALRDERERAADERRRLRTAQALGVVAWVDPPRRREAGDHPWWTWRVNVQNSSNLPIFFALCEIRDWNERSDVTIEIEDPLADEQRSARVVPPGTTWSFEETRRYIGPGACLAGIEVRVRFVDAAGATWLREGPRVTEVEDHPFLATDALPPMEDADDDPAWR